MFSGTKKRRCQSCVRSKRRCVVQVGSKACDLCLKKGIICVIDNIAIKRYNPKPTIQSHQKAQDLKKLSPMSLSTLISKSLNADEHESYADNLLISLTPKVYLPITTVNSDGNVPVIIEKTDECVPDEGLVIPKEFSLSDFVLSSIRVRSLGKQKFTFEDPLGKISEDAKVNKQLGQNGYHIVDKHSPSNSKEENEIMFNSFSEVEFKIETDRLKRMYYLPQAGVQLLENGSIKLDTDIIDLPSEIIELLFKKMCQENYEDPITDLQSGRKMVNWMHVCLPLIIGNHTALGASIVLSYYRCIQQSITSDVDEIELLKSYELQIEKLHLKLLSEIQTRLNHVSSICCDHSIFIILVLINVEVLKGCKDSVYGKLLKLCSSLVGFRGGFSKIAKTLTGLCMIKLLSCHLPFVDLIEDDSKLNSNFSSSLKFTEYEVIFGSNYKDIDFYDNQNFNQNFGSSDIEMVIKIFAKVSHFRNLVNVSCDANVSSISEFEYENVTQLTLDHALKEVANLEDNISKLIAKLTAKNDFSELQNCLALGSAKLLIYQTVYRQQSRSPKTLLLVKELLEISQKIMDKYLNSIIDSDTKIFLLPFFILGVSLVSQQSREWLQAFLRKLYTCSNRKNINTAVEALTEIWEMDSMGTKIVDWEALLKLMGISICLLA